MRRPGGETSFTLRHPQVVAFVALLLGAWWVVDRAGVRRPRWLQHVPEYVAGTFGAFWTVQRVVPLLFGLVATAR